MAARSVVRANSRLRQRLGEPGVQFLEFAAQGIDRILPHVEVSNWSEAAWTEARSIWKSSSRTEIEVTLAIGRPADDTARSLSAMVRRRRAPRQSAGNTRGTLDLREYDICRRIAVRISEILATDHIENAHATFKAFKDSFDAYVVAQHLESHHELAPLTIDKIFDSLQTLSQQSYENKALVFGCVVDSKSKSDDTSLPFPDAYLSQKKYKALSDGYRTAFEISRNGRLVGFTDLIYADRRSKALTGRHYYPDWAGPIARVSQDGRCGIVLSRQGDILVFDAGTLRFTYRYGRWHYWNHSHLVHLLSNLARTQNVKRRILGRVVGSIYRASLDISFRRSGGLFVLLRGKNHLREVVRKGEAIGDKDRNGPDGQFDAAVAEHTIQLLPRPLTVELASLDGAVVLANSGDFLAYGAVLRPKKQGKLRGAEGSRTKAAIGASSYGLAVKISSDGQITVYSGGIEFISV
jgi:hypothetical protein